MLLVTALMGAFFMSMDLAANPIWRRRLFLTLALSGGLLLLFGLVERATAAEGIFWDASAPKSTFFATYFYHANAGAFINLTLPLVAGQAILAFRNQKGQLERAFWSFLSARQHHRRVRQYVKGIDADWHGDHRGLGRRRRNGRDSEAPDDFPKAASFLRLLGVVLVCAVILILSFGIERSLVRWNQTLNSLFASEGGALWEGRVSIYRICWLSLHAAGWFGFGPGTFSIVFPSLQQEHGGEPDGILRYAHQDYLQTTLEWGAIGFLLWAVLIGGGIVRAILYLWKDPRAMTREQSIWLALCALSLVGVLIHSLVDFPLQIASLQLISAVLLGQLWAKFQTKGNSDRM